MEKLRLVILFTFCLQTILIRAELPDWIPPEMIELIAVEKKRCMDENKLDQGTIDRLNKGDVINEQNLKCYMHCILGSFGMVDEDGTLNGEMFVGLAPEQFQDKAQQSISTCMNEEGADPCDKLYNILMCFRQQAPELWHML